MKPRSPGERVLEELVAAVPPPRRGGERALPEEDCFAPPTDPEPEGRLQKCSFDLPAELARSFRALCALQGVKQRRVVERLVRAYVRQHGARAVVDLPT